MVDLTLTQIIKQLRNENPIVIEGGMYVGKNLSLDNPVTKTSMAPAIFIKGKEHLVKETKGIKKVKVYKIITYHPRDQNDDCKIQTFELWPDMSPKLYAKIKEFCGTYLKFSS